MTALRAAVITVSDGVHAGTRQDRSGPGVVEALEKAGYAVTRHAQVPDERDLIAGLLRELGQELGAGLICTTGGTGITPRDITPEATRDVIRTEIPGMAERMRAAGLQSTRFAPLSRAVCGVAGGILIVNLPGSPRGAVDSLNVILELVPHVLDLINGRTEH